MCSVLVAGFGVKRYLSSRLFVYLIGWVGNDFVIGVKGMTGCGGGN